MLLVKLQQKDLLYEHLAKMLARFQDNSGGNTGILIHSLSTFPTGRPELIQAGEVLAGKLPNDPKWRSNVAFARYRAGEYAEADSLSRYGGYRRLALSDDNNADVSCHDQSQAERSRRGR